MPTDLHLQWHLTFFSLFYSRRIPKPQTSLNCATILFKDLNTARVMVHTFQLLHKLSSNVLLLSSDLSGQDFQVRYGSTETERLNSPIAFFSETLNHSELSFYHQEVECNQWVRTDRTTFILSSTMEFNFNMCYAWLCSCLVKLFQQNYQLLQIKS